VNGPRRRLPRWAIARRLTAAAFVALLVLGRFDWFPWFKGSTTATSVVEFVPLADPLAAIEVMIAGRCAPVDLLIGAGLLLAFAVLVGPIFCGWVCPLGLLLDVNQTLRSAVNRLLSRSHRTLPAWRIPSAVKYGVLGFVLGFALIARLPAFQLVSPINIFVWALVFTATPALILVVLILAVEYVSPRLWCRSLCPLGALYGWVGRFGLLRIRIRRSAITPSPCQQCAANCPMGIQVIDEQLTKAADSVVDPNCTRCGACIDVCPRGTLRLGFTNEADGG